MLGLVVAFFPTGGLFGFPADGGLLGIAGMTSPCGPVGDIVDTSFNWLGHGLAFFGLVWAYHPEIEPIPPEWKDHVVSLGAAS